MKLFTGCCLLVTVALTPAQAGWLLWEAPKEIASPAMEKVISSQEELRKPEFVFSPYGKEKLPANFIFSAGLSNLRSFATQSGWTECETQLVKSAGQALKNLYSGQKPTNFFPAKSWLLGKGSQDLSFCGTQGNKFEIYFWRLPFRDRNGGPFWAAAVYGAEAQDMLNAALKKLKAKKQKIKNTRVKSETFLISIRQ